MSIKQGFFASRSAVLPRANRGVRWLRVWRLATVTSAGSVALQPPLARRAATSRSVRTQLVVAPFAAFASFILISLPAGAKTHSVEDLAEPAAAAVSAADVETLPVEPASSDASSEPKSPTASSATKALRAVAAKARAAAVAELAELGQPDHRHGAAAKSAANRDLPPLGQRRYLLGSPQAAAKPTAIKNLQALAPGPFLLDPQQPGSDTRAPLPPHPRRRVAPPPPPRAKAGELRFRRLEVLGHLRQPRVDFTRETLPLERADEPVTQDFYPKVFAPARDDDF